MNMFLPLLLPSSFSVKNEIEENPCSIHSGRSSDTIACPSSNTIDALHVKNSIKKVGLNYDDGGKRDNVVQSIATLDELFHVQQ